MRKALEHQIELMKESLEVARGREEVAKEEWNKTNYTKEEEREAYRLKLQEWNLRQAHADYIEYTIKELEQILEEYKEN